MTIGSFKGAQQFRNAPIDLTVLLMLILLPAVAIGVWKHAMVSLPKEFWLYAVIIVIMLVSLLYTPNLAMGLDKTERFLFIDGICIIAPFVILTTPAKMQRFFVTIVLAGVAASAAALTNLGGQERFTTPSGDTIAMGHDAALGIVIVWFGLMPHKKLPVRILLYSLIGLMTVGMVGSGSRGPFLGFALCIVLSIVCRRKIGFGSRQLWFDVLVLGVLGGLLVLSVGIPQASFNYLAQLKNTSSADAFLGGRVDFVGLGIQLFMEHPILGVGINGFPFIEIGQGNWPHNVPLEFACELGVGAALAFCALVILAVRATWEEFVRADEHWRSVANMVLCCMVMQIVSMMNTGNINEARQLWTAISLPFVMRAVRCYKTPECTGAI